MMKWFKLHHDLPDDIKLKRFTPQEKWAWVALMCLASKAKVRGTIEADNDDLAEYCEFNSTQDWLYFRDKLIAKGMLEINASGNLDIVHWGDRQHEKPSDRPEAVKQRVQKHRAPKKKQDVTPSNALHLVCNATDIDQDLELDQDPDPETETDPPKSPLPENLPPHMMDPLVQGGFFGQKGMRSGLPKEYNPEFTAERFEDFWNKEVPNKDPQFKACAKKNFKEITGIKFEQFRSAYRSAVADYKNKKPGDRGFEFFPRLPKWITSKSWESYQSADGKPIVELERFLIPSSVPKTSVYIDGGEWFVCPEGLPDRTQENIYYLFINGAYRQDRRRLISTLKELKQQHPSSITLEEYDRKALHV